VPSPRRLSVADFRSQREESGHRQGTGWHREFQPYPGCTVAARALGLSRGREGETRGRPAPPRGDRYAPRGDRYACCARAVARPVALQTEAPQGESEAPPAPPARVLAPALTRAWRQGHLYLPERTTRSSSRPAGGSLGGAAEPAAACARGSKAAGGDCSQAKYQSDESPATKQQSEEEEEEEEQQKQTRQQQPQPQPNPEPEPEPEPQPEPQPQPQQKKQSQPQQEQEPEQEQEQGQEQQQKQQTPCEEVPAEAGSRAPAAEAAHDRFLPPANSCPASGGAGSLKEPEAAPEAAPEASHGAAQRRAEKEYSPGHGAGPRAAGCGAARGASPRHVGPAWERSPSRLSEVAVVSVRPPPPRYPD